MSTTTRLRRALGVAALTVMCFTWMVSARAFVPPDVIDAAFAVSGVPRTPGAKVVPPTDAQKALVFMHNKDLNLMALDGTLPGPVYQGSQAHFETVNKGLVEAAAAENGLKAKTQAAKPGATPDYNPGTDTDIIVEGGSPKDPITLEKIQATEKSYQDKLKQYLKDSGVTPPEGRVHTDTDFMPHPDHTTDAEFTRINKSINERGGTAYERPGAAKVEAQMRPPKGGEVPKLDINDTGAYVAEMQTLADHKLSHAADLESQARALAKSNPARAQALDAEAQLLRSQASKYIDRIDKVTRIVAQQNNVLPPKKGADSLAEAGRSIAKGRGVQSAGGAEVVGDMGALAVNRGVKDYAETLARVAALNPSQSAAAQRQIAEQIKHMSPEMRQQVLDRVKATYEFSAGGRKAQANAFDRSLRAEVDKHVADFEAKKPAAPDPQTKKPGAPDAPTKPPVAPDAPTKPPVGPDAPGGKPGTPDAPVGKGAKVLNTVSTVMVLTDIGNACETLEKYLNGEITGQEAAETLVDQTLTLGLIGAGKKVQSSWDTYWDANKSIRDANRNNLVAYFTQWEARLRKAGLSADEARRMVGHAMVSGDVSALEGEARRLAEAGHPIDVPKLTVESLDYGVTDYIWEVGEQTVDTVVGIGKGMYTGGKYILTAPSRVLNAWAETMLTEADMQLQSATQEAWMKSRIFQSLLKRGVPPRDALAALNDYFDGTDMKKLRDIMRSLRGAHVTSRHQQSDWYCTNRPIIEAPVALPPILVRQ